MIHNEPATLWRCRPPPPSSRRPASRWRGELRSFTIRTSLRKVAVCAGLPGHAALEAALKSARARRRTAASISTCGAPSSIATASCAPWLSPVRNRRQPVAGQPRDLRAEGEHGECVQPAGSCAVDCEPVGGRAAGRLACMVFSTAIRSTRRPRIADRRRTSVRTTIRWSGRRIGGVNVFGGGLALYNSRSQLIGAIGVSGDTSCADHNIAWRTRNTLALDYVPGGASKRLTTTSTTRDSRDAGHARQRLHAPDLQDQGRQDGVRSISENLPCSRTAPVERDSDRPVHAKSRAVAIL